MQTRKKESPTTASESSFGFTLIELLIVIAITTLLIAILIPVANRAREIGQRAVCLSNLRQLTLAWNLYAEDNDGLTPLIIAMSHIRYLNVAILLLDRRSLRYKGRRK